MTWLLLVIALLAGCVQVGPKKMPDVPLQASCPSLGLEAIPDRVNIHIEPGSTPSADPGGRQILQGYVRCREALR